MEKLTSKEEEVMELIWQLGQCSPKDVASLYPEPRPSANAIAIARAIDSDFSRVYNRFGIL